MLQLFNQSEGQPQIIRNYVIEISKKFIKVLSYSYTILQVQPYLLDASTSTPPFLINTELAEVSLLESPAARSFSGLLNIQFASAIFGLFQGTLQHYLVIAEQSDRCAQVLDVTYYRVLKVRFIPLKYRLDPHKHRDEFNRIDDISHQYLSKHFYFTLTQKGAYTLQKQLKPDYYDDTFIWNTSLRKPFREYDYLCAILIQGYINTFTSKLDSQPVTYTLISRRSQFLSGTRFHHRGIDEFGNVANFVETECILLFNEKHISHVLYRGSVPAFWAQPNQAAQIYLSRSLELSSTAFIKHFFKFKENYRNVHCINLLGQKQSEQLLTTAFTEIVALNHQQWISLHQIDFRKLKKIDQFRSIDSLIKNLDKAILSAGNCVLQEVDSKLQVGAVQKGVFRVNCIDCLDRTNTFSSRIALRILELALQMTEKFGTQVDLLGQVDAAQERDFLFEYRQLWASHGDAISQIYCGSNSTTSEMTKQGKGTMKGFFLQKIVTIERFFNQGLPDMHKDKTIEALLGSGKSEKTKLEEFLEFRRSFYCKKRKLSLFICTWNICGQPLSEVDLTKDLFEFSSAPEVVLIGLQEIVKVNIFGGLKAHGEALQRLTGLMEKSLKKYQDYVLVESEHLGGLLLLVFVQKQILLGVTNISKQKIKTNSDHDVGAKGACAVQLVICDQVISILNVHLSTKRDAHMKELKEIHARAFASNSRAKCQDVLRSDYVFLIGDFKFQNSLPFTLQVSNEDWIRSLLLNDEGLQSKQEFPLSEYHEFGITFLPTNKYGKRLFELIVIGTNEYDQRKHNKNPTYSDRIFCKLREGIIRQNRYERVERTESDHKPVVAQYSIDCNEIDKGKERQLVQEYLRYQRQKYQHCQSTAEFSLSLQEGSKQQTMPCLDQKLYQYEYVQQSQH